jgi:hypothetical protein
MSYHSSSSSSKIVSAKRERFHPLLLRRTSPIILNLTMKSTPLVSQKRNHSVVPETTAGKQMFQRTSLLYAQYAMESIGVKVGRA